MLQNGTTLNLFMEGIRPEWEVPEHAHGGAFNLRINKGFANQIWEDLILGFIGEQFTCAGIVTGVVLTVGATSDKISIWMKDGDKPGLMKLVRQDIVRICELPSDIHIEFNLFFKDKPERSHHAHP